MSRNGNLEVEAVMVPDPALAGEEPVVQGQNLQDLAANLAGEFTAPVGILDPVRRMWQILLGASPVHFPRLSDLLFEMAGSSGLRLGRVALWRPKEQSGRVWLVLPLPWADVTDVLAFVGFLDVGGD
jgi:hypothetical protein